MSRTRPVGAGGPSFSQGRVKTGAGAGRFSWAAAPLAAAISASDTGATLMAGCGFCGTTILFGGQQVDGERYCNDKCHAKGVLLNASQQIPNEVVEEELARVLSGSCPQCSGPGPVDVFKSHTVWSMVVLTSWRSTPRISCRGCATKSQLKCIASSALFGWWGFPWGVLMTPVQIGRNLMGLGRQADPSKPTELLEEIVRVDLAVQAFGGADEGSAETQRQAA